MKILNPQCGEVAAMALHYESGMNVMFDVVSKVVFVEFRGKFVTLPGQFSDRPTGIKAREYYCRERGWGGTPPRAS